MKSLTKEIVGSIGSESFRKMILDTTHLSKEQVENEFYSIVESLNKELAAHIDIEKMAKVF